MYTLIRSWPFQFPQLAGTLEHLSKYHVLADTNHIQIFLKHNTKGEVNNWQIYEWENGDFIRSFLGNPDTSKYFLNNTVNCEYFYLKFQILSV